MRRHPHEIGNVGSEPFQMRPIPVDVPGEETLECHMRRPAMAIAHTWLHRVIQPDNLTRGYEGFKVLQPGLCREACLQRALDLHNLSGERFILLAKQSVVFRRILEKISHVTMSN